MWKVSQIMANAEKETARGYEIYGYYLNLLKNSNAEDRAKEAESENLH